MHRLPWRPAEVASPAAAWLTGIAALSNSTYLITFIWKSTRCSRGSWQQALWENFVQVVFPVMTKPRGSNSTLYSRFMGEYCCRNCVIQRKKAPTEGKHSRRRSEINLVAFLLLLSHLQRSCILCSSAFFALKQAKRSCLGLNEKTGVSKHNIWHIGGSSECWSC